ncbi:HlyD family efflux transporter periplasmic adaptor subunit [Paenibacillus gorillae]|uniref:HlyD family efflux transporter periplasmic adaptor subunit n=1 Tax=Paenibacillus gorillae TaxID=1243662 RepID=UPI0004AFC45B|nr:lipoyl domain-containing protein [Paenibacillus gorillae]
MKVKTTVYLVLAVLLIAGGSLLAIKGRDAVSQAENRKQGILESEQTAVRYGSNPGKIIEVSVAAGDTVKKGDSLFKVQTAEGSDVEVIAPEDGFVTKIAANEGDAIAQGMPLAVVQKTAYYTDIYVQESQIQKLQLNQSVKVHFPNVKITDDAEGVIASIAAAPQFASLRMSREKGQADLSMYLVRVAIASDDKLMPGMTAEVDLDEIAS